MKKTNNVQKRGKFTKINHKVHVMKRISSEVKEITINDNSLAATQKRMVIYFKCACQEEDILYRQLNLTDDIIGEYSKPA